MGDPEHITESGQADSQSMFARLAPTAVLIAAVATAGLFGIRTLRSEDLGNHLLYGQQFWRDGRIVDHNDFLYTATSPDTPADQRPEPGPGAWYDDQGRYRFPNANWLSQALLAGVYRIGGWMGLGIALMVLVWSMLAMLIVLMRRLGAGPFATAGGLIAICLASYDRFVLRPELFGYLILLGQAIILAPLAGADKQRRLGLPGLIGLVVLQAALVNVHSYFLIGLGLTAAVAVASTGRLVWERLRGPTDDGVLSANVLRLLMLVALQAAVCLANPWTWRLAALPFQTATYLRLHGVSQGPGAHPWSWLIETRRTFLGFGEIGGVWRSVLDDGFGGEPTRAMIAIILLGAVAAAIILIRRGRWAQFLWLLAGGAIALSMIRNVALGAILMTPIIAAAASAAGRKIGQQMPADSRGAVLTFGSVIAPLACAALARSVVTSDVYPARYHCNFGLGRSSVIFPNGATGWLDRSNIQGRIWTDYITSANLYFLLDRPRPEFPILTNTWAYPPAVLAEMMVFWEEPSPDLDRLAINYGVGDWADTTSRHGVSLIVSRIDRKTPMERLWRNDRWALVHLEGMYAVFVRVSGRDARLVRRTLTESTWSPAEYVAQARRQELRPAHTMSAAGRLLMTMAWHDAAVPVLTEASRENPRLAETWFQLGSAHATRALVRRQRSGPGAEQDVRDAIDALRRGLALRPNPEAENMLRRLQRATRSFPQSP